MSVTVTEWVVAGMVTVPAGSLTVPAEAAAMLPAKAGRSKITGPPRQEAERPTTRRSGRGPPMPRP